MLRCFLLTCGYCYLYLAANVKLAVKIRMMGVCTASRGKLRILNMYSAGTPLCEHTV